MKTSTGKKPILIYSAYALLLVITALYSVMIYRYVRSQINDNVRINSAGRLRMLSQKITKNTLLFKDGVIQKHIVESSLGLFNESIHAIAEGGTVPLDMERAVFMKVPPMNDPENRRLLNIALNRWEPFEEHITRYLEHKNNDSLRYVIVNNDVLLDGLDQAVLSIQKRASREQVFLGLLITSAVAMIIIWVAAALLREVRRYREASARLAEIERLLPICAGCKKIRTDEDHPFDPRSWISIEEYLRHNKDMIFTHSLCPDCMMKYDPDRTGG